jgi:hypothetical protein
MQKGKKEHDLRLTQLESLTMEVKLFDNDESCNNIQIKGCYIKYI